MLELDVTHLVRERDAFEFSASIAERGANAARETWHNAKEEAADTPLLKTEKEVDTARAYFREFGAWSEEELAAMSAQEVNALAIQYVSGDIREAKDLCPADDEDIDWKEYEALAERGTISGNLYPIDRRVFFSMSH